MYKGKNYRERKRLIPPYHHNKLQKHTVSKLEYYLLFSSVHLQLPKKYICSPSLCQLVHTYQT